MKYFFRILLVLVLAVGVVFGMYYYTNGNPFENENKVQLTTVSQQPATEKNSNRVLIASLPDDDYYLYKGSTGVILTHGKNEYEFKNWSRLIDAEPPQMVLTDIDRDGEKEILIRAVSSENETTHEREYDVYMLDYQKGKNGGKYNVFCADRTTWGEILNDQIREEVGQLKSCKKTIQVSMNAKSKTIAYDSATGIAKNGYNGYARSMQDGGNYLTFDSWTKGKGVYTINKKKELCISVEVNIKYKESPVVQTAGNIKFKLEFRNGEFRVKNKTMNFTADDAYRIADPRTVAAGSWSYTENNANKSTDAQDRIIDWVKYTLDYSEDTIVQTVPLGNEVTDAKHLKKIKVTESYIELTAKDGFNFDDGARRRGDFSVIINKGSDVQYDIAYTAKLMEINGEEVLTITFDKAYPQSEIHTIEINYGAK